MFIIPSFIGAKQPPLFDADYQAVLNYATSLGYTLPSAGQQVKQNQLMLDLKSGGIWSKLDTFAVFANDGGSNFALIDWKRLVLYTAVNSPTFGTNGGFTGNGTSSYIDTNYNPATQGVNYTLNNAGRFFWVDNRSGTTWEGTIAGGFNQSRNQNTTGQTINTTTLLPTAVNFAIDGFHAINRTSSNDCEFFVGTTQISRSVTSTSVASSNQAILRSASTYNASRFRFYAMGASLVSENNSFNNAMTNYFNSL